MAGLVLSRKRYESFTIVANDGGEITITVAKIRGSRVSLQIDAPDDQQITRSEIGKKTKETAAA